MILESQDKEQMMGLIRAAALQLGFIERLTIDANTMFQPIVLTIDEENAVTDLLNNPMWPQAVDPSQIVNSEADKIARAEGIIDVFFDNNVKNTKFLDFGCGEGHVPAIAAGHQATMVVGYDIAKSDSWTGKTAGKTNLILTDSLDDAKANAPYDNILFYDVLDHCTEPTRVLKEATAMLAPGGKVVVRTHPWCSRHGGHLYRAINKAYAHVFLTDATVTKLSGGQAPVQKLIHPQTTYALWFDAAGLKIDSRENVETTIEPFFQQEPRRSKIVQWWRSSPIPEHASGQKFPEYPMSQEFIDFVLSKKE